MKKTAFTLVELIVVITILAILGTIAFTSLQGYSVNARDSVRISDLKNLEKGFELIRTKDLKLPIPQNKVDITASGTIVSYQGYAGLDVSGYIGIATDIKDPKDKINYTYISDVNLTKYQILGFLENSRQTSYIEDINSNNSINSTNIINKVNASIDYTNRFPIVKGKELGIFTSIDNTPIQETGTGIDIVNTNDTYKVILNNTNSGSVSGTGSVLAKTNSTANCKRIYDLGERKDGIYTINPAGVNISVYCDMTTDGGGWTLIARSVVGGTGNFGWNIQIGSPVNDNLPYSIGDSIKKINFDNLLITRYDFGKNISLALKLKINNDINTLSSTGVLTSNRIVVKNDGLSADEKTWNHAKMFSYRGQISVIDRYFFRDAPSGTTHGLLPGGFNSYQYNSYYGAFHQKQGMIFVK